MAASRDGGNTWSKPVLVVDRAGTRALPWIAAPAPGEVGLVWYETNATLLDKSEQMTLYCRDNAPADTAWYLHYASTKNPFDAAPSFTDELVQAQPITK